jgi:hypothetical protein
MDTWNPYTQVIMRTAIQSVPATGVSVPDPATPYAYELRQNYPNPFNPATEILYSVTGTEAVKITVYDVLGREVAVLVDEKKPAGRYTARFDGTGFASGVYFYRIASGGFTRTLPMLLLK